jgi:hypothetical protein
MNKLGICLVLNLLTLFLFQPVLAEDSASVRVTIQSELVSVTTNVSNLDYGLVLYGSSKKLDDAIIVTNSGNVPINVELSGSDAVEKTNSSKIWELVSGAPDTNKFRHGIGVDSTNYTWLTSADRSTIPALNNVGASVSVPGVDLVLFAPLAGSNSGTFETNVYFRAVKAS